MFRATAIAASVATVSAHTYVAVMGAYPPHADNWTEATAGHVLVTVSPENDKGLMVSYDLSNLQDSVVGGLHIHSGMTCDNAKMVGGHYWDKNVGPDPWGVNTTYTSDSNGTSVGSFLVDDPSVYPFTENHGHAVVVHAEDGSRVGCGILRTPHLPCGDMPEVCSNACVPCLACPHGSEDPDCEPCVACDGCDGYQHCLTEEQVCDNMPEGCGACEACAACFGAAGMMPECDVCKACDVCESFAICMEADCSAMPAACEDCEACIPCIGVDSVECEPCAVCAPCEPYAHCEDEHEDHDEEKDDAHEDDGEDHTKHDHGDESAKESGTLRASIGAALAATLALAFVF